MKQILSGSALLLICVNGQIAAATPKMARGAPVLSQSDLVGWILGLGVVTLLILILAWALRRLNHFSFLPGNGLRVLGGLSLGTRERVVLLQVGEKQLLLGVAPGRIETLHVLEPGELLSACADKPAKFSFAAQFKQRLQESRDE